MGNPAISRHSFSKTAKFNEIPDLLSLQVFSWDDFLQEDIPGGDQTTLGIISQDKNITAEIQDVDVILVKRIQK